MRAYRIEGKSGYDFGVVVAETPAAALVHVCRDAGCGPAAIRLAAGELVYGDGYKAICGTLEDWNISDLGEVIA